MKECCNHKNCSTGVDTCGLLAKSSHKYQQKDDAGNHGKDHTEPTKINKYVKISKSCGIFQNTNSPSPKIERQHKGQPILHGRGLGSKEAIPVIGVGVGEPNVLGFRETQKEVCQAHVCSPELEVS